MGLTVVPGEGTVAVEAVESGPQGNVPANAITVVPSNEDPMFLEVRNPGEQTAVVRVHRWPPDEREHEVEEISLSPGGQQM